MEWSVLRPAAQAIIRFLASTYMRGYHRFEVELPAGFPRRGAMVGILNHASYLDALAFAAADPSRPPALVAAKESLLRAPVVGPVLRCWGVIPVGRDGRDVTALRAIAEALRQGR